MAANRTSSSTLSIVVPAGTPGAQVDVQVTGDYGTSSVLRGGFTYEPATTPPPPAPATSTAPAPARPDRATGSTATSGPGGP